MHAVGIVHVVGVEPALGRQARRRDRRAVREAGCRAAAISPSVIEGPDDGRPCASPRRRRCRASSGAAAAAARPRSSIALARTSTRRKPRRLAGHHRDARGEGAHARNAMRSVRPCTTRTRVVIDAERIGANLRHHRLDALPDRGGAGHDLDRAGRIDRDLHAVERPEPALLDEDRQAPRRRIRRLARRRRRSRLQRVPARRAASALSSSPA